MLLPALPAIQDAFGAPRSAVQATVSVYLLAFACGILLVGPLSDRLGRRPVLLGGISIFLVGSLLAAVAPSLPVLIAARVIQALGSAAGLTVARAVAGDVFHGADLARMLATVTMAMMLGTTIAPWVGGQLLAYGWHASFWVMLGVAALVLLAAYTLMPETRRADKRGETAAELWREAKLILRNPLFTGYTIQAGVIYAIFLAFIAVTPYIMARTLQRPETEFGIYYMVLSAGYFAGNFFVSGFGRRYSAESLMYVGLALQVAGAALGLLFALLGYLTPGFLFFPQLPLAFGQGLALPHISARAVQLAPGYPGVASSLIGFSQQAIAGISVQLMGLASVDSTVPINLFCFLASVAAFSSLYILGSAARSRYP
jgi:DHA1 family bicyclomycin/chloramphenicol resistance-like MFS transporter